jgi:hypothetical protein
MLDLRANGIEALVPFVPIIASSFIVLGSIAIGGVLELKTRSDIRTLSLVTICILLPIVFIVVLGYVVHWRALPRHFIPLTSLLSLLYAFGIRWWLQRGLVGTTVVLMSLIVMGYSSLSVRYAPRHAKDDYKRAAELAKTELAHGGRVWWVADLRGALYYGIVANDESGLLGSFFEGNFSERTASSLSAQTPPTLVLLSKPDTWDRHNVVRDYLVINNYHLAESFPAFTAWSR